MCNIIRQHVRCLKNNQIVTGEVLLKTTVAHISGLHRSIYVRKSGHTRPLWPSNFQCLASGPQRLERPSSSSTMVSPRLQADVSTSQLPTEVLQTLENPSVDAWLRDILSKDAITFEGAYWCQRPPAESAVPKVLQAMAVHFDLYTRGKLIELLGECEDREVLPILEKEPASSDESIRNWANGSIDALAREEP